MVDGIIFDLDGTLWDSTDGIVTAWNEAIRQAGYGISLDKPAVKSVMGLGNRELADRIFPMLPSGERMPLLEKCFDQEMVVLRRQGGRLMDGIRETLEALSANYPLFIVSNCQDGYVQTFLDAHKMWDYFKDFRCAGGAGLTKGESNRELVKIYGLSHAVYVGDTEGDRKSANEAGIPFIYAEYGFGRLEGCEYVIGSLGDIFRVLERM